MTIYATRRDNLRILFDRHGGKQKVALKLGYTNASYISQMAGPNPTKKISEEVARKIEKTFDLPEGCMDKPQLGETASPRVEEAITGYAAGAPVVLNDQLLADSARTVLTHGRGLNSDQTAEVIALVYRCGIPTGKVDLDLAKRLIALVTAR